MKNELKHGLISGILAGLVSVIFLQIYHSKMGVNFSEIAQPIMIIVATVIGTVIASIGYWFLKRQNWFGNKTDFIFYTFFFILSFISIFETFDAPLPEGTMNPELFAGLVIPMHFFPILSWLMVKPIFDTNKN